MPVTSSSMELSDPETPDTSLDMATTANRRKSGRATRKPVLLNKDPNISQVGMGSGGKRKRVDVPAQDLVESSDAESENETSEDESDPDEEELKERRRKAPRPKKAPSKSVAKKPRTGPALSTSLAVRPAVNGVKKNARPKQPRAPPVKDAQDIATGLYCTCADHARLSTSANSPPAEVFSEGHTLDAVATDWIARWEHNNAEAMCDMVNFVIKCTGCDSQVDVHDIGDQDNAPSRLGDIQEEYHALNPTDYPLISKAKGNSSFRSTLSGFFATLISTCHAAGLLYSDLAVLENIEIWVHTMSSSTLRPFRHTATVIALTIGNTLCIVAAEIADNTAKTMRQKEGEQKKKSVNKERVKALEAKIAEGERRRTQVLASLKDLFDAVFVHRYRDVDPKIRLECVTALGNWITTLPDVYFDSMHLRYLGWVLSDVSPPTRAEVIKQLGKLFKNKDNAPRLRTFTEKFRARMVEMAVRDSEVSVRAATVELLDMIRKTGLLEPDDIDIVGGLIFDAEPRVRKAVASFFAENVNDMYEATVEDFGGEEALAEILGEEVEDDFDTPRSSWLKLKCVAEALQSYDAEDDGEQDSALRGVGGGGGLIATGVDSRYAMAARTIYEGISVAREWKVLAGYLLFDLSSTEQPSEGADATFESRCKLNEKETIFLLEILNVAVKARLSEAVEAETDKRGHKTKARKEESRATRESTALRLAKILPQLLKKFGSSPTTASAVLRLGQVLDLEIFQELRQDFTTYASLLDDINKQFLTHTDQGVLAEASTAILHAREFEDLEEVTESKVQELWDDTINTLRASMSSGEVGNISELCITVRRIANLASISDCVAVLDQEGRSALKKKAKPQSTASPLSLLMEIIRDPELDNGAGEEADETLISAVKAILFYYMWTVRSLQTAIPSGTAISKFPDLAPFAQSLETLIENRPAASSVRLAAVGTILDIYTLFATFRHVQIPPNHQNADEIQSLVQHIPSSAESLILSTYTALEKSFAKKSHRTLEAAPDDDLASDPEDSSDDEDDVEPDDAQQEILMAEKRLCEVAGKMVLAIVGRVLDCAGPNQGKIRERLKRNKLKLGGNFKEVVAYLDGPKPKPKPKKRAPPAKRGGGKKTVKAVEVEDEDEDEDEESEAERRVEEGGEEDLRARELVEDRIVDAEDESAGGGEDAAKAGADEVDEDDIMGD